MRMLVVYCHPCPDSFSAALRDRVLSTLRGCGHETRLLDLHAEGFDPVMSDAERRAYHTPGVNEEPVAADLDLLRWCEGLIFVYPTWWYAQPAMLKGWLDRVWVPHATFTMPTEHKGITRVLTNIRVLGVVTTLGSPWWWWTFVIGAPGRKIILRGLRALMHPSCRTHWLALHKMDTASQKQREAFLDRVERELSLIDCEVQPQALMMLGV
jgi:putative NADPH-quinone reductase